MDYTTIIYRDDSPYEAVVGDDSYIMGRLEMWKECHPEYTYTLGVSPIPLLSQYEL